MSRSFKKSKVIKFAKSKYCKDLANRKLRKTKMLAIIRTTKSILKVGIFVIVDFITQRRMKELFGTIPSGLGNNFTKHFTNKLNYVII